MDDKLEKLIGLLNEATENIRRFFATLFQGDGEMEELSGLLRDGKGLYNPDGTLTEEYLSALEKAESRLDPSRIDEALIASASSPEEADAIRSIIGFVEDRDALMQDYGASISAYDEDARSWMEDRATEGLDEGQKELRIKKIDDVLSSEEDILD